MTSSPPVPDDDGAGGAFRSRVHLDGMSPSSRPTTPLALRRAVRIALVALCVAVARPAVLGAQIERSTLPSGVRVRVRETSNPQPFTGSLWHVSGDTYAVRPSGTNTLLELPRSRIVSIDVSDGRDRLGWGMRGTGIGLLAGGVLGAVSVGRDSQADLGALVGFIAGGILGAGAGALIGATSAPERWRRIPLEP
jgi:hypothetical protein